MLQTVPEQTVNPPKRSALGIEWEASTRAQLQLQHEGDGSSNMR
jgi:hypothetical protein